MENELTCITEAALYKLAFRSNKPAADAFTNWVASEVLPSIHKTGQYVSPRR
jgi:prophage antirepressor-like protein